MINDSTISNQATIVIVQSGYAKRQQLTSLLAERGHNVRLIPHSEELLQTIQAKQPDLLLLDIQAPGQDGLNVCRTLQADELTFDIPIIYICPVHDKVNKDDIFLAGAVDYVTTPLHNEEILARVETQLSLRILLKEMKNKNHELDAFAGMIAHDLRSPLTSLIMRAQALQKFYGKNLDEKGAYLTEQLVLDGRRMADIIESLLKLARLRHQQPSLSILKMHLLVAEAIDRLDLYIEQGDAKIEYPETWPRSIGYVPWIIEVWVNYIGNAIKYGGENPKIELGFSNLSSNQVKFWVKDNGRGIAREDQTKLFTPFSRLEHHSIEGYGLGLSIVKRIVTKLGGDVGVDSRVNEGSTFWFSLPASVKITS